MGLLRELRGRGAAAGGGGGAGEGARAGGAAAGGVLPTDTAVADDDVIREGDLVRWGAGERARAIASLRVCLHALPAALPRGAPSTRRRTPR